MQFRETARAIFDCEEHLAKTESFGTVVESYLVQHLLVLVCREYELALRELVVSRAAKVGDPELQAFTRSAAEQLIRSVRLNEVSGLLGRFGVIHKQRLQEDMRHNPAVQASYDSIINNRNLVAHIEGVQVTFQELKTLVEQANLILREVARILGATTSSGEQ